MAAVRTQVAKKSYQRRFDSNPFSNNLQHVPDVEQPIPKSVFTQFTVGFAVDRLYRCHYLVVTVYYF